MHKCVTCGRAFARRDNLRRHSSRCRPKPFVCAVCKSSFGRKDTLDHHKRTVQGGGPPQPGPSAPKRRRIALNEDPLTPPPVEHAANDNLSRDLRDFVHEIWASVRTHVVNGPVQTRYNYRLTSMDTRDLHEPLGQLFDEQTTAFKVNLSFGFILKEKQSGRLRYYHSSCNCCGRYLEEPALITNCDDFDSFLERIHESRMHILQWAVAQRPNILQWAVAQRPNSDWVVELVTNVTLFINKILQHPIVCVGIDLPDYVKRNKAIVGLEKDRYRKATYNDNLCLFRCLGLHLGREAAELYAEYTDTSIHDFAGVTIEDLHRVETKFKTNVVVYQLVEIADGKTTAGNKILLATPLLQWYLAHGLVVDRVYQIVEYERKPCGKFRQFGESVSTARRAGDADPDKAIIAHTMKLLGNSAYGKTVTNIDRHRNVRYCTEVGTSLLINNKRFQQLDVVTDDAYEVTASKARLTYDMPLHIGFFVYQYAKLRMLQFYYDFVDRYVAGVNNHFVHNRFVIIMHSTSHSSKSIVLPECAVLIVDTSSGPSTSTVKWTRTRRTSRWPATASTTS